MADRLTEIEALAGRLYAPAAGGNTRPLRTEAANALTEMVARVRSLEAALREAYTGLERAQFDAHDREWSREMMARVRAELASAGPESDDA